MHDKNKLIDLRGVDLNLLPVLQALLIEESVSGAARVLHLSQPAVSHALTRLRHLLEDPLLVQIGRRMQPTPRALALRIDVDACCSALRSLFVPMRFNPENSSQSFTIATPDYLALLLSRELLPRLREQAPGVTIFFAPPDGARDKILQGKADLALIAEFDNDLHGLKSSHRYLDSFVCITSLDHPLARKTQVTMQQIMGYPVLVTEGDGDFGPLFPTKLMLEQVRMSVSHLTSLLFLVSQSTSMAIVPRALTQLANGSFAKCSVLTIIDSSPLHFRLVWSPAIDADPAQRWLRSQIEQICSQFLEAVSG